jgi:hypothetical protein
VAVAIYRPQPSQYSASEDAVAIADAQGGRLTAVSPSNPADIRTGVDRWIFVFMAGLFLATTLAGFIPDSLAKIAAIQAGERVPFPAILHIHAVLMACWLMLLLAQTSLMATGRGVAHRTLGLVSLVLLPAILVTGLILVPTIYRAAWQASQVAPPQTLPSVQTGLALLGDIALLQIRIGVLVPAFVVLALLNRRADPASHKRWMILGTAMMLPAATDRISWLPTTWPVVPLSTDLYVLLLIAPMFAWDLFRLGHVHRAYMTWGASYLPSILIVNLLWNSPWWLATAPVLMGVVR